MNEIKCPHCGQVFTIDESNYNSIVKQIRDHEFYEELNRREEELNNKLVLEKKLVKNDADSEIEKLKNDLKLKESEYQNKLSEQTNKLNQEIASLKAKQLSFDNEKTSALKELSAKKDNENIKSLQDAKEKINELEKQIELNKLEIRNKDTERDLAVSKAVSQAKEEKDKEVSSIRQEYESYKIEATSKLENTTSLYEEKLSNKDKELLAKQEQVDYYKDLKTRMSTKMIGETLEQHCFNEFERLRPLFKNAYFEKDNDASSGSKGDFIFRDFDDDGIEILSIMFEMKNEADTTASKHKNEDFFKELDKDRKEKKCEYAILVSMLEADSELYNNGIVDVSHRYPKMYVVRPQFFISIITILRNAALNTVDYKKQLMIERNNNLDVKQFEDNMLKFKEAFGKNYETASKKFNEAIDEIDKSILHLQKIRDALTSTDRQLRLANDKAQDLSIKKLTKNAPSVLRKFEEADNEDSRN